MFEIEKGLWVNFNHIVSIHLIESERLGDKLTIKMSDGMVITTDSQAKNWLTTILQRFKV